MDFDRIATSYEFLKRIVFGQHIDKASNYFLQQLPLDIKILILGGGSGEILRNFQASHQVKYIEVSEVMIRKAKTVHTKASVDFVSADILEWENVDKFDLIITPFVLDFLTEEQLEVLFNKYKEFLKMDGKWIHTDFYPKNIVQKLLIKMMYVFFNLSVKLKTNQLANFDMLFTKHGFICKLNALFFHSMIESKIYTKIE